MTSNGAAVLKPTRHIDINAFPPELQGFLRPLDEQGDGRLDINELSKVFQDFQVMKDAGRHGALYLRGLPESVQEVCAAFDDDKSGSIQVSELARAAKLYKEAQNRGRRLAKLAIALVLMIVTLMAALGVLMYVVVDLSKDTEVKGDGAMRVKGEKGIVRTMTADMHVDPGSGEFKDDAGQELTMPAKAQKIALTYQVPTEIFARMDMMSVNEVLYSATAKVTGVYKTAEQLVVNTPLFRVLMLKSGNRIVQPLDDILESATVPLPDMDLNALNVSSSTRRLLEESGGGRRLLQAYRDVLVKLTDDKADTDPSTADKDTVIKVRKNAKCTNMHQIGLRNNHFEYYEDKTVMKDQTKKAYCDWETEGCDREVLDYQQCADAAKSLMQQGTCATGPALFGFRTVGIGEGGCYCVPAGQECEPQSAEYGDYWKTYRNYPFSGPPDDPYSSIDYSSWNEWEQKATGYHGEQLGWNIYMVEDPTFLEAVSAAEEEFKDNNDVNVTTLTPIPEDPNIELVYTGQVCMNVKKLYTKKDVENGRAWSTKENQENRHYTGETFYAAREFDLKTAQYEFLTVDQCMDLARADPDCIPHGPTIQFHDYGANKPEAAYLLLDTKRDYVKTFNTNPREWIPYDQSGLTARWNRGYLYAGYHCSCSVQCDHDTVRGIENPDTGKKEAVLKRGTCRGDLFSIRAYNTTEDKRWTVRVARTGELIEGPSLYKGTDMEGTDIDYEAIWTTHWIKARIDTGDDMVTLRFPPEWHLGHFINGPALDWNPYRGTIQPQQPQGHCLDPAFRYRFNEFDVGFNEFHGLGNTNIYTYRWENAMIGNRSNAFTGTDSQLATAGLPECVRVAMGRDNVGGDKRVTMPSKPYVCPSRVDNSNGRFVDLEQGIISREIDDVFHIFQEEVETEPGSPPEVVGRAFRLSGGSEWGFDLQFVCCLPELMSPEDFADDGGPSSDYTLKVGTNPTGKAWLEGFTVPEGYTCPAAVSKDNWLGGYTSDRHFIVMQDGTSVKLYTWGHCGGWDDMYLQFNCQFTGITSTPALSPSNMNAFRSTSTVFVGDTGPPPAAGTSKTYKVPRGSQNSWIFGMKCPATVDKSNWMVRDEDLSELMMDQTFAVQNHGTDLQPKWSVTRTDSEASEAEGGNSTLSWNYPLAFPCTVDKCMDVYIGSSEDAEVNGFSKWFDIPPGFTCPATVSKKNWLTNDPYSDYFSVLQEQKGSDFNVGLGSEAGSRIRIERTDAPGAGWGMKLQFSCCVQYECVRLNIGKREEGAEQTYQIPDGYKCPAEINKSTWLGGFGYPDKFLLFQNKETYDYDGKEYTRWKGNDITVKRIDECDHRETAWWGMPLQVDCCKPVDDQPWVDGPTYHRIDWVASY